MVKKYDRRRRERMDALARERNPRGGPRVPQTRDKAEDQPAATGHRAGRGVMIAICGLLLLGTVLVFAQTAGHKFVNCDDNEYIYENTHIQRGLTWECVKWAVTGAHSANWHPLTWMAHALDWQLFGHWDPDLNRYVNSWPGGHHLVNVLLHAICVVLLFLTLQAMTGATWPSAAVAALFAIHPLHVESVAWATGRKDTLSALFFLLILAAYQAYAKRPFSWWRYALVAVSFMLGLAAKPMLVTVPFVLLLLDFWPLRRIPVSPAFRFSPLYVRVLLEKVPLLALSVGSCFLTTWAQGLVAAFKPLDFHFRVENALLSYAAYIGQMFWPAGMVVQYVHKGPSLRFEDTWLPLAVLVPITLAVLWFGWRRRYLLVGWLWYVGMLVPVIGLVQVGAQARADRYTYVTQIGLYIMLAWGLGDLAKAWRDGTKLYAVISGPVLAALAAVAWLQTSYWQDSLTLWEHSVACQPDNDYAQNSYADALHDAGRLEEANAHHRKSFEINWKYVTPRCHLAGNLYKQGKSEEALRVCDEALQVEANMDAESRSTADEAQIHFLKAIALYGLKQVDKSIDEFRLSLRLNPKNADAHSDLAEVLRENKQYGEAHDECMAALTLKPEFPEAHRIFGNVLLAQGDIAGAGKHFRAAMKLKPDDPQTHEGLAEALWRQDRFREAVEQFKQELALQPQNIGAAIQVVRRLVSDPRPEARFGTEALEIARRACGATGYKNIFALEVLAGAYAETGDFEQAEAAVRKAMETPLGQEPKNAEELQKRVLLYRAHRKPMILSPKP